MDLLLSKASDGVGARKLLKCDELMPTVSAAIQCLLMPKVSAVQSIKVLMTTGYPSCSIFDPYSSCLFGRSRSADGASRRIETQILLEAPGLN